ncbi:MAG: outer membrane protein assembly factor BamA [Verrucomicrobiota bacterium]
MNPSALLRRPAAPRPLLLSLAPLACALALPAVLHAQALPGLLPPPASAESAALAPATGPVVRSVEIRFKGEATVDRERILSNMRLKTGEIYTREKEEQDLRALYNTGDLLDVQFTTTEVAGGIKLTVTVEARAGLGNIEFLGNTVFTATRLQQEIELKIGGSVDDTSLAKAKDAIIEVYKAKGYPDVTVDYSVTKGATPGFSRAVFSINEGGRGIIKDVIFEGATSFSSGKLKSVIKSDNRNWIKFWDLKRRVDRTKIEEDIKAIEEFYQNAGYLDAKVTNVVPQRVDDKNVNLVYSIVEGPVYTVAAVTVAGNKLYQTADLIPVFQLEAGQTFSLADMKIDLATIADYYGSRGYADSKVTPRIDKQAGSQLGITYAIEEGNQFKVGKISISGNQKTKEEVVRRELTIAPTDEYNTIKIRKSQSRLMNLDYFEGVDFMPVSSDLGPDYKDINIDLKEKPTGSVQFGAGFSSIDNLVGFVEVSQKNFDIANWPSFTGAGQRFRLGLKAGTERKDFIMSLTEPYFLGQRLSLGGDLFYTEKNYLSDYYDERDVGGSINLRKPLGDNTDLRLTYTLQQVEIYDIDEDASEYIKSQEGDYLQSRLGAAWVFDNRDSFQMPTRGHKISVEGNLSGSFLGGDVDTVSLSLSGQKYWKMPFDTIFSLQGEVASVDTTGDGDSVPIFERQFLGGANNLRGFEYRDVGPKDENGEPIGGNTLGWITAELTFPIVAKIRGAVFADAGFVNPDSWDYSSSDYNADIGLGVRVNLPLVGPVKIDYGIPITTDEFNDDGGQFQFSVDYKF